LSIDIFLEGHDDIHRREAHLLCLAFAILCIIAVALAIAPSARIGTWGVAAISVQHFIVLPVWVIGVILVRRTLQEHHPRRDPLFLPITFLLSGWGMLVLWRVAPTFGARQTGWFLVASMALIVVLRAPTDLKWLRQYRYLWLLGGILLTALTLAFGTNPSGGEPKLWLGCCGIYFQPSEPLRLFLVAFLASYFADRIAYRWVDERPPFLITLGPLVIVWTLSVLLLFVQHDLGTGTLFLALLAILLFIATDRWQILLTAIGLIILGAAAGYTLFDVVKLRLQAWFNPWLDPTGGSYQVVQSLIAIASGGIFGRGPGLGAPGFVPAAHTDFIFTALCEEWGLLGGIAILALLAIFISRGIKCALHLHDPYHKMLTSGLILAFAIQSILIIGGVIRTLPLTGVTLPFVSYGGSSLVTSFLALGLLIQLSNKTSAFEADSQPLKLVQAGVSIAWIVLALSIGWWSVVQSETLKSRTDNPRRVYAERFVERGRILDVDGQVLSESVGSAGSYMRRYSSPAFSSVLGYNSGLYGLTGIEKSMDPYLRGEEGYDPTIIFWSEVIKSHPPPGLDVRLTLDFDLQETAFSTLQGKRGSAVVLQIPSGDLLALVTTPTYDANSIEEDWDILITRTDAPLLNRTTQAQYQPGLAFTPFLTAWGLENGLLQISDEATQAQIPINIDGHSLRCSISSSGRTSMDIALALRLGCPKPFAQYGVSFGADWLSEIYTAFKFDQAPSIRLDTAPATAFTDPEGVEGLELAAIGQGEFTITPLQLARAFAALANNGVLPSLRLIDAIQQPDGTWIQQPALVSPITILNPQVTENIMSTAIDWGEGILGFNYQAISGPEGDRLSWFMGSDAGKHVVIVVLENEEMENAKEIGLYLLRTLQSTPSP
jgi:cell division protein FtsW (lipid II flippase)